MGNEKNAQELVEILHNGTLNSHDAVDVLTAIIAKIESSETTWEELGTSYGACYAEMRFILRKEAKEALKNLREGLLEPERAREVAREILEKSLFSLDELGTTLKEMTEFISSYLRGII
ncbi:MAG: hypothetical protein V1819_03190 [bacterium]